MPGESTTHASRTSADSDNSGLIGSASNGRSVLSDLLPGLRERILRGGPTVEELALIVGVAELFPGVFCAAYDMDGRYQWISDSASVVVGAEPSSMLGRSITDFFSAEWCAERIDVIREVLEARSIMATVEIFGGKRLEGAVFPVELGVPSPLAVIVGRFGLALAQPGGRDSAAIRCVQLVQADWGSLRTLSRRELDVLRLIAKGLSNPEIARALHRTKRAVEWHIKNLYARLGCDQRTSLFRRGLEAGLADIDDAHWAQIVEHVRQEP